MPVLRRSAQKVDLLNLWLRFMKWGLILAFPLMILVFASLPVIDRLSPWPEADAILEERFGGSIKLCVGINLSSSSTESERQRSFLLVNRMEMATVYGSTTGRDHVLTVEASKFAFWFVLVFVAACVGLSIRFSIPQITATIKTSRMIRNTQSQLR